MRDVCKKNKKSAGLTLMELIIVLAIVAIVGAILIPNFLNTTDRARLRSDIQSARVLQSALDLYNAEQSSPMAPTVMEGANGIIARLVYRGYLDGRQVWVPQTHGASFTLQGGQVVVNLSSAEVSPGVLALRTQLSASERLYVFPLLTD